MILCLKVCTFNWKRSSNTDLLPARHRSLANGLHNTDFLPMAFTTPISCRWPSQHRSLADGLHNIDLLSTAFTMSISCQWPSPHRSLADGIRRRAFSATELWREQDIFALHSMTQFQQSPHFRDACCTAKRSSNTDHLPEACLQTALLQRNKFGVRARYFFLFDVLNLFPFFLVVTSKQGEGLQEASKKKAKDKRLKRVVV